MVRKIMCATFLVLIVALPNLAQTIESKTALLVWWPLDEGEGTVAVDHSGNGYDGAFVGDPQWVAGYAGSALYFDGIDDSAVYDWPAAGSLDAFTVALWVKSETLGQDNYSSPFAGHYPNTAGFQIDVNGGNPGSYRVNPSGLLFGTASTDWVHLTLVADGTSAALYYNGVLATTGNLDDTQWDEFSLGVNRNRTNWWAGTCDDLRVYNRTISAAQVEDLYDGIAPTFFKAEDPNPADGAEGVTNPLLTWVAGENALFHDVYLGADADLGPEDLVAPRWIATLYWHAAGLEPGTVYYWRIDEVAADGTVYTGDVWRFAVTPLEAWQPDPMDGAPYIDPNATLSWATGLNGVSRDVYFGAEETAVAEGTSDTFKGNQFGTSYVTGDLEADTTYYWRIDEVDATGGKVTGNVWSFTTLPDIPITDPNLRGHWTLDEGIGLRAVDWSGHGAHAEFIGDPEWVDAYDGFGVYLDGTDDRVVHSLEAEETWSAYTVSVWAKADMLGLGQYRGPFSNHVPNSAGFQLDVDGLSPGSYRYNGVNGGAQLIGPLTTEWVFLAATSNGTSTTLYYNGYQAASIAAADAVFNKYGIGVNRNEDNTFEGIIDDVHLYDRELTFEELQLVMRIDPLRAWQPHPADGAMADVRTASPLTWSAGDSAAQHDVYLGTDEGAVAAADPTDASGIYRNRIGTTSYSPPESIEWNHEYFWRIDEVNGDGSITHGRVWSFFVPDYLIVDDFESYTDESPNRIFQTWLDGFGYTEPEIVQGNGTGSTVGNLTAPFAEQTVVYSGRQSMPMDYNNAIPPFYSEAERTWATPQDWRFNDVQTLVLHFHGYPVDFIETAPGAVTMSAAGTDIWDVADEFRFAYRRLDGDGTIIACVDSIENTDVWAKGGVMIRESLDPGSRHAMVVVTPGSGVAFQRRTATNDVSVGTTESGIQAPRWVKLTRTDNTLTAQHSTDGVTWVDVGTDPAASQDVVVMGGTLYIGLALTSHSAGNATAAEFSEIQTTGGVSGQWQVADIGVEHPGNSPDSFYIAVEDSGGSVAVLPHPDAGAVLTNEWRRWTIDLDEIAGVNLRAVKKMYIGVGDRDNPQPAGAGKLYIDDIRIVPPLQEILTVAPAETVETTGDDGMVLSINGIAVEDLVLGTTSTDFEKWADHPAPHADDFDLSTYASLDDSGYITMMFNVPVSTVFIIERGANDEGGIQPLGADGYPVGLVQAFAESDWHKPGIQINNQDAGAIVITAEVPISGIMVLPPEGANIGLDPACVCGIAAQ